MPLVERHVQVVLGVLLGLVAEVVDRDSAGVVVHTGEHHHRHERLVLLVHQGERARREPQQRSVRSGVEHRRGSRLGQHAGMRLQRVAKERRAERRLGVIARRRRRYRRANGSDRDAHFGSSVSNHHGLGDRRMIKVAAAHVLVLGQRAPDQVRFRPGLELRAYGRVLRRLAREHLAGGGVNRALERQSIHDALKLARRPPGSDLYGRAAVGGRRHQLVAVASSRAPRCGTELPAVDEYSLYHMVPAFKAGNRHHITRDDGVDDLLNANLYEPQQRARVDNPYEQRELLDQQLEMRMERPSTERFDHVRQLLHGAEHSTMSRLPRGHIEAEELLDHGDEKGVEPVGGGRRIESNQPMSHGLAHA
mmetsp:Transcript_76577/g.219698  ORF Transcript_76577/g.219698 Transcript_76577/m.219698 type:complete len:364 (+) Transcript_76577:935-2026(+)